MSTICRRVLCRSRSINQPRNFSTFCSRCRKNRICAVPQKDNQQILWTSFKNPVLANNSLQKRFVSADALSPVTDERTQRLQLPEKFRCDSSNPAEHTSGDIGLFYTIPEDDFNIVSPKTISTKAFDKRSLSEFFAFNEHAIMIRKPSLEIINYLKHTDYSLPVQRYLIYGDLGSGKSYTLQHVTHHCIKLGWLIVPTFQAWDWGLYRAHYKLTQRTELLESQWNKDRFDQPDRATSWLEVFKWMNKQHLINIKTTKDYIWTKRERTDAGTSVGSLVDLGIARPRLATDIIGCIMREIRVQDSETMPRTLVAVDSVNALFSPTLLRVALKGKLTVEQLAFHINLKKLMSNIWRNGAVVCAMSCIYTTDPTQSGIIRDAENTYKLLGRDGFDLLDPHIPVEVPNYSDKEVLSQLAYYEDRKWLNGRATTDEGRQEIMQLACNSPRELVRVCNYMN